MKTDIPFPDIEFVAFDLETTGLLAISSRIVEIGAVRFRLDGTELDAFEQLVDPQCEIPSDATHVNGITNEMVRGKPPIGEVLPQFIQFLGSSDTILLAHNAGFDLSFLGLAMAKLGVEFPQHVVIDTLELAQKLVRGTRTYKLEDLAIHLRVAEVEDHRGLSDSRMLARVFRKIVARSPSLRTVSDLFAFCRRLSFADGGTVPIAPPPGFESISAAIEEQRTILLVYEGGSKGLAERRVTPRGLIMASGRSYLCAFCHDDGIEKSYRLDRVREFRVEEKS